MKGGLQRGFIGQTWMWLGEWVGRKGGGESGLESLKNGGGFSFEE